jgi:AcrR family transcriptional regulator
MPAPTDHSIRRREIARHAVRSIARAGWDGATLRAVADEGGWSVGVVQHYFRSKTEVLVAAVDYLVETTYAATESVDSSSPLEWLTNFVRAVVPHSGGKAEYWRVWICFWAQAQTSPSLDNAVASVLKTFHQRVEGAIKAGQAQGTVDLGIDPQAEAAFLAASIIGLGIVACLNPDYPPDDFMVERLVGRLRASALS